MTAVAITDNVYVHVPVSPFVSESVPDTMYEPTERGPVVDIDPEELAVRLELELVVTNVTGPTLPSTVIGPAVNVPDELAETEPDVKEA
jgi:hypothetical protein